MGELGEVPAGVASSKKDTPPLAEIGAGVKENLEREGVIGEHIAVFQKIAETRGINPVEGGLFMMVDGIKYTDMYGDSDNIDVNTDGKRMAVGRVDQVGQFETNNGVMTYIDEKGRQWLGAATAGNYDALHNAGYERGGIFVPFSNGETPTDPESKRKIRDVLTGKEKDQLEEERKIRVDEIINLRKSLFGDVAVIPERGEIYEEVAEEGEPGKHYVEKSEKDRAVEDLNPHDERDNAGYLRRIYKKGNVTFSFKGREEMPVYPTCQKSQTELISEPPSLIDQEEFGRYKEQLEETPKDEQLPSHLVVNKTLQGVIDLAIRLGSKDSGLLKLSSELKEGVYGQRALDLLDALVAVNYADMIVNKKFNSLKAVEYSDIDAEAIVLMGLMGDERAQKYAAESVDVLKSHDRKKVLRVEQGAEGYEPLSTQDLCAVHTTHYMPERTDKGYRVQTKFDAQTERRIVPRHTIHTTLNHTVEGHAGGSWDTAGVVIISPLNSMLKENGLPFNLSTVDTFWERNPGEGLVFPDAELVIPGGRDVEGFYEKRDGVYEFKSEGLEMADLLMVRDYYLENNQNLDPQEFEKFKSMINNSFNDILTKLRGESIASVSDPLGGQWDYEGARIAMDRFLLEGDSGKERRSYLDVLTQDTEEKPPESIKDAISKMLVESGATKCISAETENRETAVTSLAETLEEGVKTLVFAEIKKITVKDAIESRGFAVQPGGNWAWGGDQMVSYQTIALAKDLGAPYAGAHSDAVSKHNWFEERIKKDVVEEGMNGDENGKFDWPRYSGQYDYLLPEITPKSRRVLYDSGLLTSRVEF